MSHPTLGIDHCFALVHDLEAAARQFCTLGFTLSPRGLHSEAKGSANYTIMFPHDYFEILGLVSETALNKAQRDVLETAGEGLHAIACRIEDATGAARALEELGIATEHPNDFERPVDLPGGGTGRAAFSTVSYATREVPRGTVFMCQHKTPETVWLPSLLSHANGATGLAGIVAISDDPQSEATRFARLWKDGEVISDLNETRVLTGADSAPLILQTPEQIAAGYIGVDFTGTPAGAFAIVRITTNSMEKARAHIEAEGIQPINTANGFAVPAEYASGCVVEFVSA